MAAVANGAAQGAQASGPLGPALGEGGHSRQGSLRGGPATGRAESSQE
jgi:hypothetical protein